MDATTADRRRCRCDPNSNWKTQIDAKDPLEGTIRAAYEIARTLLSREPRMWWTM